MPKKQNQISNASSVWLTRNPRKYKKKTHSSQRRENPTQPPTTKNHEYPVPIFTFSQQTNTKKQRNQCEQTYQEKKRSTKKELLQQISESKNERTF